MKLIECPRDAMQGIKQFIPTKEKVQYLNALLKVGFDTLDFGSFVSPKAIPQMRDTKEVLENLDLFATKTKLLAIVANLRGAEEALALNQISYLGFPLSLSETFQQRNTNRSINEALITIKDIQEKIVEKNKSLVVYLSMGFGNPYNDPYSESMLVDFTGHLSELGVNIVSLADTIGTAQPDQIRNIFPKLMLAFPFIEFGAHLHSTKHQALEKIEAVIATGCQRMDSALLGYGGCPMAKDDLTGNIDTLQVIQKLSSNLLDNNQINSAVKKATFLFNKYQ